MNEQFDKIKETFGSVKSHRRIGKIIRQHSTNDSPIEAVAYSSVNFNKKIRIADVGCGYGRSIEYITGIAPKSSKYIGFDLVKSNERKFIELTKRLGYSGEFVCGDADRISDYPDQYFDLILCNYSLYFFVESLPNIAKKLNYNGLFIAITHSDRSLYELLSDLQKIFNLEYAPTWSDFGSEPILDNFNSKNGVEILMQYLLLK